MKQFDEILPIQIYSQENLHILDQVTGYFRMHTHKTVSPPQRVMIGTDGCSILNLAWKIDWLKALAAYFIDEEKEGKSQFSQIFSSQLLLFASMCCSYPTKSLDLHYNPPKFFPPSFYAIYAIYFLHVKTVFFPIRSTRFACFFPVQLRSSVRRRDMTLRTC